MRALWMGACTAAPSTQLGVSSPEREQNKNMRNSDTVSVHVAPTGEHRYVHAYVCVQ
jgi:hypothetical protein